MGPGAASAVRDPQETDAAGADGRPAGDRSAALALGVFVAYLAVGALLVLLRWGRDRWFFSDEWLMIAGRDPGSFEGLFRPNNAHWTTLPAIAYDVMWRLFGVRTYLPYQAMSVATHVAVVVLVRVVVRRAGVSPWLATVACLPIVVFGAGSDNIVWAFQISNTGAVALGLVQLLLVDHDGPIGRRDLLGLLAGLAALMCSGVAVAMVAAVGLAVLVRRGWRAAALQVVPLAATYGLWVLLADPQSGSPAGRPSPGTVVRWVARFAEGSVTGLGGAALVGIALAVVTVVGVGLLIARGPWTEVRARLAGPAALAVGALAFSASISLGRWHLGTELAASSRYVYTGGVLLVPLVALGAQEVATRWRPALPVVMALFLVAVPLGWRQFGDDLYGEAYFAQQRQAISTAAYTPFAADVPDDVRPVPNPFLPPELDMAFLREARRDGKLDPPRLPLHPTVLEAMRVRLGLAQRTGYPGPVECTPITEPLEVDLEPGDQAALRTPIEVVGIGADGTRSQPVPFVPVNGAVLTVELPLTIEVRPLLGARGTQWCGPT